MIITLPTLILPVFVAFSSEAECEFAAIGWTEPLLAEALVPADPGGLQKFDSGGFLQDSGEALLDRLGSLGRDFLSEFQKFPVLRGHGFDVLAALRR